jgi:predicted nuclease of predicted toxin-antitoxin system
MRVLLDENVDRKLKRAFSDAYEVVTVREAGWGGKENGELLSLAEEAFDVLVTLDGNMRHQQYLPGYALAVVLITARSNKRSALEPAMLEVNRVIGQARPGELYVVEA